MTKEDLYKIEREDDRVNSILISLEEINVNLKEVAKGIKYFADKNAKANGYSKAWWEGVKW